MSDERTGIDAVEVVASTLDDGERYSFIAAPAALAALFASGGIEGDGDLVLRRRGDDVRVVGRLAERPPYTDVYRIVEAPDAG